MADKEVKDMSDRELLVELVSYKRGFAYQSPPWFMAILAASNLVTLLLVLVILFTV